MKIAATIILSVVAFVNPQASFAKSKVRVQLYAQTQEVTGGIVWVYVYLILPNGDHAKALCGKVAESCSLESFAPERRRQSSCELPTHPPTKAICFDSETYEADRKKNDITLYGGNGKVTYHINGTW